MRLKAKPAAPDDRHPLPTMNKWLGDASTTLAFYTERTNCG